MHDFSGKEQENGTKIQKQGKRQRRRSAVRIGTEELLPVYGCDGNFIRAASLIAQRKVPL